MFKGKIKLELSICVPGLARLFLKEYYTKLSDCPGEAGIFYGDDSRFVHGEVEETGREVNFKHLFIYLLLLLQNIQRAIDEINFQVVLISN